MVPAAGGLWSRPWEHVLLPSSAHGDTWLNIAEVAAMAAAMGWYGTMARPRTIGKLGCEPRWSEHWEHQNLGDGCQTPHLNFSHWPPESLSTIKNSHVMCHCLCLSFPFLSALSSLTHSLVFHRRLPETSGDGAPESWTDSEALFVGRLREVRSAAWTSDGTETSWVWQRHDSRYDKRVTRVLHMCFAKLEALEATWSCLSYL